MTADINLEDYYPGFSEADFRIIIEANAIIGNADTDYLRFYQAAMLQFRDTGLKIYSSTDGQLDIVADTAATLTAPTLSITSSTGYFIYAPDIRLGFDSGAYMKVAVTDATGVTAVTFVGSGATYGITVPTATLTTSTLTGVYAPDIRIGTSAAIYMKIAQTATTGVMAVTFVGGSGVTYTLTAPTITFAGATAINLDGPTTVTGILTIDTAGSPADGIKISATTPVDGLEISSSCSANAINLTGTANLIGIHYNVDMTTQIGANVEGIKVILERTADIAVGTSNILGAEFIIKQGSDSYAAGMAPQITGVRIAMGGANTKATVYGLKCETQSNGYVTYLGLFSVNDGGSIASGGATLYVRSYPTCPKMIKVEQPAATTCTDLFYLTDNVGTGTITNLITINARNTTNFLNFEYNAGCIAADATGDTWTHRLAVNVEGVGTRYIKLSSA